MIVVGKSFKSNYNFVIQISSAVENPTETAVDIPIFVPLQILNSQRVA